MDKSLSFCKERVATSQPHLQDRDFDKAHVVDAGRVFGTRDFQRVSLDGTWKGEPITYNVEIAFDAGADFEYFTSETLVHDGTLIFSLEAIAACANRVLRGETYNINKGFPRNFNGATLRYTIGDFVVIEEIGDRFKSEDKPYCNQRTTVMLPIKYSFVDGAPSK